jgi:Fe-S-cluster containining protein
MKLEVLHPTDPADAWYADGLKFTCTQCGNCCTGGPGVVWISNEEIDRLAELLDITRDQTIERYCRSVDSKYSLKESRNSRGEYDCVFLKEERITRPAKAGENDEQIVHTIRSCTAYAARPLQCRTWPFWAENLVSEKIWNKSAQRCHGMNRGKVYTPEKIHALRDAKDWPKSPPTSARK